MIESLVLGLVFVLLWLTRSIMFLRLYGDLRSEKPFRTSIKTSRWSRANNTSYLYTHFATLPRCLFPIAKMAHNIYDRL